uniref:BZIP domain-containing protein n=1 Tax=Chelydra serpentina TaxID=8475 RepID=A0A8C3T2Q9_CHESE
PADWLHFTLLLRGEKEKLKRRQKNRAAAQRSRQKHTEKADELHQQHELLEHNNTVLKKEIEVLNEQLKYWTQMLKDHESTCPDMLTPSLPTQTPLLHWPPLPSCCLGSCLY